LISAKGKTAQEMLQSLKTRLERSHDDEMLAAKLALCEITLKRLEAHPLNHLWENFIQILKKHQVKGASVALTLNGQHIQRMALGESVTHQANKPTVFFQMASLSKTVGSCFAIEYFKKKNVSLETSVNSLLKKTKSSFRLKGPFGDQVLIKHLMNHSALNMHYVNGVPLGNMPPIAEFLSGVEVINPPGEKFKYSGGGFIVLEHLIEAMEEKSIFDLTQKFLDELNISDFTFKQENISHTNYAHGYKANGEEIKTTRLMFPAFAAGAMGTSDGCLKFLTHLSKAFASTKGSGPISHDTARIMLHGTDLGCMEFMHSKMGLGVFIAEAGENRLMLHQGANDGFRCIYLYCYQGPDQGKGIVVLCNGELNGVLFISEIVQMFLKEFSFTGVDFSKFQTHFSTQNLSQEEVVNIGYKNLIFKAFNEDRPEEIVTVGPKDPLADFNLCVGGKLVWTTNERFARGENLLSPFEPVFDPELFGRQGKIMDSWESVRHNPLSHDELIFSLKNPSEIRYVSLSTKYHHGNQAPLISLEAKKSENESWSTLLPKTSLEGHALKMIDLETLSPAYHLIKVSMYPDGGFTRLGLFKDLPEESKRMFVPLDKAKSLPFAEKIPATKKPLSIPYKVSSELIKKNVSLLKQGEAFDVASLAYGGKLIKATNEHYGPAIQVISPYSPINMFDGLESARSRIPGHSEEVIVGLGMKSKIHLIEMDFTYFVNNNPLDVSVFGLADGNWIELLPKTRVKAFAGNKKTFSLSHPQKFEQIRVVTYPDGGMNRLHIYSNYEGNS
jgi:allantoicase/CubicO group peptidase (beta-lactamase class C family)